MRRIIRKRPYLIPFFILIGVAAFALFGWVVMLLWNGVLAPAVGANLIGFWQAVGILILSRILVGGFGGGRGHRRGWHWRDNYRNMSPEEKAKFKEDIRKHWGWGGEEDKPSDTTTIG